MAICNKINSYVLFLSKPCRSIMCNRTTCPISHVLIIAVQSSMLLFMVFTVNHKINNAGVYSSCFAFIYFKTRQYFTFIQVIYHNRHRYKKVNGNFLFR